MSTTKLFHQFSSPTHGGGSAPQAPWINQHEYKKHKDKYVLVDVRELDEGDTVEGALRIPMGALIRDAKHNKLANMTDKKLVITCNSGHRAAIAAAELRNLGFETYNLYGGVETWGKPTAFKPGFVVLLTTADGERVSLGLAQALAALDHTGQVALCFMHDAVYLASKVPREGKEKCTIDEIALGGPYPPAKAAIEKFVAGGGIVFACKSCKAFRGLSDDKLFDWVHEMQGPDLARFFKEAEAHIQL